jgi:nicotinate-nucleotide adenylyltransferase
MHVGLFFGSFNPVHVGHMVMANYMLSFTDMEQLWFVVSPQNPLKTKTGLLAQHHRLALVDLAIDDHQHMRSSNIEFSLPQPSYTINTLVHLQEKYPQHTFSLIIGQDNLQSFKKWKNYERILESFHLYVYPRPGCESGDLAKHPHVHITDAPLMELSSTFIRNAIRDKKDVRYYLPAKVWQEIELMHFYKK